MHISDIFCLLNPEEVNLVENAPTDWDLLLLTFCNRAIKGAAHQCYGDGDGDAVVRCEQTLKLIRRFAAVRVNNEAQSISK